MFWTQRLSGLLYSARMAGRDKWSPGHAFEHVRTPPADRGSGSPGTVYLRADPTWPLPVLEGSLGPELTAAVPKGYASVDGAGFVGRGCHFHDSQHTELEFMKSVPFARFHTERTHKGSSQRLIQGQPGCCSSRDIPEGQLPGADPSCLEPRMLAVTRGHTGVQAESTDTDFVFILRLPSMALEACRAGRRE